MQALIQIVVHRALRVRAWDAVRRTDKPSYADVL